MRHLLTVLHFWTSSLTLAFKFKFYIATFPGLLLVLLLVELECYYKFKLPCQ